MLRQTRDCKEKESTSTEKVNPGLIFSINITFSWKYTFLVKTAHHLLRKKYLGKMRLTYNAVWCCGFRHPRYSRSAVYFCRSWTSESCATINNFNDRLCSKRLGSLYFCTSFLTYHKYWWTDGLSIVIQKYSVLCTSSNVMNWFALSMMHECKVSLNESSAGFYLLC